MRKKYIANEKNDFAEVSENLDADFKIILSDHQNNYAERSGRLLECRYLFALLSRVN